MLRKITAIMCAVCLATFSACSFAQDNNVNDRKVDEVALSAAEDIAKDAASVAGKDYGNISMPENINIQQPEGVYILETKLDIPDKQQTESKGRALFEKYFGDEFDESCFSFSDGSGAAGYENGEHGGSYSGDLNICKKDIHFNQYEVRDGASYYDLPDDCDKALGEGYSFKTAGDACDNIRGRLGELLGDTNDLELSLSSLAAFDNDGDKLLFVSGGYSYKGIMLEEKQSPYFKDDGDKMSFYSTANVRAVTDNNGEILSLFSETGRKVVSAKKQDRLLLLSDAAELLHSELSELSDHKISSIELRYCCRVDDDTDMDKKTLVYEPTWIFVTDSDETGFNRSDIKVSAVTGEIFLEVDR
ncbi:hypothetical protein [Ruminococcus sp. NK3A76]|uniref:hypothetical protein n=1 Tax=Ruminococcus sp. NK3A76 TaxID=877411 RepID=UPI00048FE241|nr:hypothetical protein [Ruminococcus sp. NK3A76]